MNLWLGLLFIAQSITLALAPSLLPTAITTGRYEQPTIPDSRIKQHQARVKWSEVNNVDYFSLKLLKGAQGKKLVKKYTVSGEKKKKTIKTLDADTTYYVRLKAYYKTGEKSRYSKKVSFHTDVASTDDQTETTTPLQFGLNFLTLAGASGDNTATYTDLQSIGVQTVRQLGDVDLYWSSIEPTDNNWNFSDADAALAAMPFEPIVTLFRLQYASGTPPWADADDPFQITVGTEAADYVATVVDRYKDVVTYWEIGNEMDHWIALDPSPAANEPPDYSDGETFTPEQQGAFLAQVSAIIRAHDSDAVIVLPGMGGLNSNTLDSWLTGVVAGGGTDWFDIVNYHYYLEWNRYAAARSDLTDTMITLGISDKPVWNTEAGTSSDPTLTTRTNYPNSDAAQASDIFRRMLQAYAAGDELVIWHTYAGNNAAENDFRYYGILDDAGAPKLAYYSMQLFTSELLPFNQVEAVDTYVYAVKKMDQSTRYVVWSATTGNWTVPAGITEYTSVVPTAAGEFTWQAVQPGDSVALTTMPILAR